MSPNVHAEPCRCFYQDEIIGNILPVPYLTPHRPRFNPATTRSHSSLAMVAMYFGMRTIREFREMSRIFSRHKAHIAAQILRHLLGERWFLNRMFQIISEFISVFPDKMKTPVIQPFTLDDIEAEIDARLPVLISDIHRVIPGSWRTRLLGHLVVIVGKGTDERGHYLVIIDPWGNPGDGYETTEPCHTYIYVNEDIRLNGIGFMERRP